MAFNGLPIDPDQEPRADPASMPAADELVRPFVEHWGGMARAWGINATMGELFALLYLTGEDWDAEGLRACLGVSRGNVSMNLRELITWGLVHKVSRAGERREFYRAEGDVWTLFRRILQERKRRELDPTLEVLDRAVLSRPIDAAFPVMQARLVEIQRFFRLIDALANRVLLLDPSDVADLSRILDEEEPV